MTRIRTFPVHHCDIRAFAGGGAGVMKFEEAGAMLAASCGKDIDDNCRGVNFDPTRLKECLNRNQDVVSANCQADFPPRFAAIQQRITARTTLFKLCNWELNHLCGDGPAGSRQGAAMPVGLDQEGDAELQQGDISGGVSLMPRGK